MAAEANLEILFRFLMLYYNSPDGLRVLVPTDNHRALLRDIATDTVFRLSEARISLEIDGKPASPGRTTFNPNGRLIAMEEPLHVKEVKPAAMFLAQPVHNQLNAIVDLPGGTLTAYPAMAFPEHAEDIAHIAFGPVNHFDAKITDTTFYQLALPAGRKAELIIASPRRTLRVDVSDGGRFELRNEDNKTGAPLDRTQISSSEFETLLRLLDLPVKIECDYFQCLCAMCGK